MQSLVFFNKEGDNLNFTYNQGAERWEGDLLFHENSDDTFKTIGLYTFERIPSFEYENIGNLKLRKFQLFNEYRLTFLGNSNFTQSITKIELPNLDPNFYSKWIYGDNFESKFPKGSQIIFDDGLFEFSNPNQSYTVVETKKNAILILGNVDNKSFNDAYGLLLTSTSSYVNKSISGLNTIGFYNYLKADYSENFSSWSEPDFYDRFFEGRKLNVIQTQKNDGIYTVKNKNIFDRVYYKYELPKSSFTQSGDLSIQLTFKTELPLVYTGPLTATASADGYRLYFGGIIPQVLKPGSEFVLPTSLVNTSFIVVDSIPTFLGNTNLTFYQLESQVLWNNLIYQCVQSYTWSATSSITPDDSDYWRRPSYLPVTLELFPESILNGEVHLSSNVLVYSQPFTQSNVVTLSSAVEKYKSEFRFFGLDLYYLNNSLNVDLIYATDYCLVEFYNSVAPTQSLSSKHKIYEHIVQTSEILKTELNVDTNENFRYNIVLTDLDEYGLKITINKQVYQEEINWVYEGSQINLQRTIDKTIRKWYEAWYLRLFTIGIIPRIGYTGKTTSIYYNTICLITEYPNVPMDFVVEVGTTADFYIEHSEIIFKDVSNYLSLNINDRAYDISVATHSAQSFDISTTLDNWVDTYQQTLDDYGIYVSSANNVLTFRIKKQDQRLEYRVSVGKSGLPAEELYVIRNKYKGRFGSLITSNEIILPESTGLTNSDGVIVGPTWSFEDEPFATGQIVNINNTVYPWNNQEYNILVLEPQNIILSYEGPFWSTIDPKCEVSPYVIVGFSNGFGATGCFVIENPTISLVGEFDYDQFQNSFNLEFGASNSYVVGVNYGIPGNDNLKDLFYASLTDNIYILGNKLTVIDANIAVITNTIDIPGLTGPISVGMNPINDTIYCFSSVGFHTVDPYLNRFLNTFTFSNSFVPKKFEFNSNNGDVYVVYENSPLVHIWNSSNFTSTPTSQISLSGDVLDLVFNPSENDIYISQNNNSIVRIEGSTRQVVITYPVDGVTGSLFYEPSESSIYVFDAYGLRKINNGISQLFPSVSAQDINYFVFDNNLNQIVISQTDRFSTITLEGELIQSVLTPTVGPMVVNQYDGDVYLASQVTSELKVLDTINGSYKWSQTLDGPIKKIIYNPSRDSIFGIIPTTSGIIEEGSLIELKVSLATLVTRGNTGSVSAMDSLYGALDPNYVRRPDTWLKVREYIRKPRENYNDDIPVDLIWKWEDDQTEEIFLYDFSGEQLTTIGSYSYIGEKPLELIALNSKPNRDITKVSYPEYQQTIFDQIVNRLDYIDSETDITFLPEPVEIFIGFNAKNEGPISSVLKLYKRETIKFTIKTTPTNYDIIQFTMREDGLASILLNLNSDTSFVYDSLDNKRGLKSGQVIQVFVTDVTNTKNKYLSHNYGIKIKLSHVFNKSLIGSLVDRELTEEFTVIEDYPKIGKNTYLSVDFVVLDNEIGSFDVYGQTEIEDIRYKIELSNNGQLVAPTDTYIFKSYDINEQGIDWTFLNQKRKELLMVRDQIYPFIGSYKAIINAINYFGYNDLELYEYYRNVNVDSVDFDKLFKIEIPDIFDNTVEGWTPNDFIKHTMPNPNFEETNLFNLTFKITDKEGTNVLLYSLDEVIIKLQGLKYWLQSNVIPLTHKILDITGRADFVGVDTIQHRSYDTRIVNIRQEFSPVDFTIGEAYLMPINSGSTVYTCIVDFTIASASLAPDYFNIKVRTYKTYKEWAPFVNYNKGDKVQYFQQIYESAIDNNRLMNPRKYDNVEDWSSSYDYVLGDYSSYDRDIYQYIGTQSSIATFGTQSISPVTDIITNNAFASWAIMSEWKISDYLPVQTLNEFRTGTHSYNFTVDSNIDPFVVVEVTSDNGYGQIYTFKKNYEIRGTKDLVDTSGKADPIGPFEPIVYLEDYPILSDVQRPLPGLTAGQSLTQSVGSDQPIFAWEIVDLFKSCIVNIEIEETGLDSVNIIVNSDPASGDGLYRFILKAVSQKDKLVTTSEFTGSVDKFICPNLSFSENRNFTLPITLPSIDDGLSTTISASADKEVNWEIINFTYSLADVFNPVFSLQEDTNCIVKVESAIGSPDGNYSFQIRAIAQENLTCISTSGVISGKVRNPITPTE